MQVLDFCTFLGRLCPTTGDDKGCYWRWYFWRENRSRWWAEWWKWYIVRGFKLVFDEPFNDGGFTDAHIAQKHDFELDIAKACAFFCSHSFSIKNIYNLKVKNEQIDDQRKGDFKNLSKTWEYTLSGKQKIVKYWFYNKHLTF